MLCVIIYLLALPPAARADSGAQPASSPGTSTQTPSGQLAAGASGGVTTANVAQTGSATPAASPSPAVSRTMVDAVSANPGAVNIISGTGLLGRTIGLDKIPGVFLGGVWVGNGNYLITGGFKPGKWSFNSLVLGDLVVDFEELAGLHGSQFGVEVLQFNGQDSNADAGSLQGYNGLPGPPPLNRTELYELWWRQSLFHDKLVIRVGKVIPTYDFNNVSAPVPVEDTTLAVPSITSLLYAPIFINSTLLGAMGGYYNSVYGVVLTYAPTKNLYLSYGSYDGSIATGVQTGLREAPTFNGHYFNIGEAGYAWALGSEHLPGRIGVGGWVQTGELYGGGNKQDGTGGFYTYGSQRLWRERPGIDSSGISAYFQFGIDNSTTRLAKEYWGSGLTGFGLIPGRPDDSLGAGFAWAWLNTDLGLNSNEFVGQIYYQMHLIGATFLEPALSYIPNPGDKPGIPGAVAITSQLTVLF